MRNFLRMRDGDRFWYERFLSEEVTTEGLLYVKVDRCESCINHSWFIGVKTRFNSSKRFDAHEYEENRGLEAEMILKKLIN